MVALGVLLFAEWRDSLWLRGLSKTIASSCFLWLALAWGATESTYGILLLTGLAFCWLGDVLLIKPGQGMEFLSGFGAFLFGHLAYAYAFSTLPLDLGRMALAAVFACVFAWRTLAWLQPHLNDAFMSRAVVAYCVAILTMLVVSAGAGWWPLAAAATFAVSDLSVARDRFIKPGFNNVVWGLPLYYFSQALMAYTLITQS